MFSPISSPKQRSPHEMADYLEMLCLMNKDHEIDASTAARRVYGESDLDLEGDDSEHDLEIEYEDVELDSHGNISPSENAESWEDPSDKRNRKADDWFRYLQSRPTLYADCYPFIVGNQRIRRKEFLSDENRLYIYLLLSSNLRIVQSTEGRRNILTTDFERLCTETLRKYLPGFSVRRCGKSSDDDPDIPRRFVDLIDFLAQTMRERCILTVENRRQISNRNTGDGGVDVVAYRQPHENDTAGGSLIVFGQCACGDDWKKKKMEAHPDHWGQRIAFLHQPATVLFIPYGFRDSQGKWARQDIPSGCILMDRLRICRLLTGQEITNLQSSRIVEKLIGFSEDI